MIDWPTLRRRSLEPTGFADDRVHIWPRLLGVDPAKLKPQPAWSELPPHRDENQIKLDTTRSFVLYPYKPNDDHRAQLQSDLHDLIVSVFRKRPKLSYFQGYHDIVSVVFLTLPRELQLACAEKLSLHRLRDSMGKGLEPVLGLLRVTKNLINLADPELSSMLEQSSPLPFFALSNLLTLFAHDTPTLPLIQHVFDYLLCRPPIAAVYLAAAITLARKDEVRRLHDEDEDGMIHSLLSSLPHIADEAVPTRAPGAQQDPNHKPEPDNQTKPDKRKSPEPYAAPSPPSEGTDTDNDTTIVASPSPKSTQDPEEDTETEGTPFSPPPESDLTLVDTPEPFSPRKPENNKVQDHNERSMTPTKDTQPTEIEAEQVQTTIPTPEPSQDRDTTVQAPESSSPLPLPPPNSTDPSPPQPPNLTPPVPPTPSTLKPTPTPSSALTLTSLLTAADTLYTLYPPTHPSLHLSSTMGPQSVTYTWSENFYSWPSDTLAENMVTRPELVVYPHVPSDASGSDDDNDVDSEDYDSIRREDKARGKKKKKLRKSSDQYKKAKEKEEKRKKKMKRDGRGKKPKLILGPPGLGIGVGVERKAMVAGAVVVLGLAVAVYGVKNGQQQSPTSPLVAPAPGFGSELFGSNGFRGLLKSASGALSYFTH